MDASGSRGEVLAILEHARAQLVTKCWTPTDGRGGPPHETVRAHVVFDADGQQLGRSFLESGEKRPGVGTCLELTLPPMHISPPGEKLTLEVPFSLP